MAQNTLARTAHDAGLAAWFGGSLMGAVGLNTASGEVSDPTDRLRVANAGWGAWTPVQAAAILAHLIGGAQVLKENKGRVAAQQGVATASSIKTAATGAALGVTAYSGLQGKKLADAEAQSKQGGSGVEVASGVDPAPQTPSDVAAAQKRLKLLQWLIPLLTGIIVVTNVKLGEQQRPTEMARGLVNRVVPGR